MPVVLVVEDETLVRMVAVDHLIEAGFRVLEARDADEALEILSERTDCRAIITDVKMPGSMDGIDLAHVVAERWPTMSIAVVSGHARPNAAELPAGAVFLPKPYRCDELIEVAASLVSKSKSLV